MKKNRVCVLNLHCQVSMPISFVCTYRSLTNRRKILVDGGSSDNSRYMVSWWSYDCKVTSM